LSLCRNDGKQRELARQDGSGNLQTNYKQAGSI